MNSKRWFKLVILFIMAGIIILISIRNISERSQQTASNRYVNKKGEIIYTYKSPDGALWTHKDKNALERLREHYSLNSPEIINRIEAERQPIEKTLMETAVVIPSSQFRSSVWSDIAIGACTLIIGFVSLYALRSHVGVRSSEFGVQRHLTNYSELSTPNSELITPNSLHTDLSPKLKTIIIELLYHLVTFSQENPDLRSERFKELIDDYVGKLKTELPQDEFEIIERELKKLVTQQWKLIKSLIEGRDKELKALITTLVESMDFFAKDNANFSLNIDKNLSNIENILTINEIKEIRERITGEITYARKIVEKKQQSDSKKIDELSFMVKSLNKELSDVKEEAQFDSLTRLYNRKTFDSRLVEKIDKSKLRGTTFTLALIDIDYFKRVNDTFGHAVGDEVLRNFSTYLKNYLNKGDFIARYGGEEFAVILDEGNRVLVQKLLDSMRENISKQKFNAGYEKISVTVSVGISFCKWHDTAESLIKRVDKVLYSAKKGGRNMAVTEDSL